MFDYVNAIAVLNKDLLAVVAAINPLTTVEYAMEAVPPRLREQPQQLTVEQQKRLTSVITAHNIVQYSNKFHNVVLREKIVCWIDWLIDATYIDEVLELKQ